MFRYHALGGVSAMAIQAALLAPSDVADAQSGEAERCRPSPSTRRAQARRAAANRARARPDGRHRGPRPRSGNRPVVVVDTAGAGANASLGTPAAVARFQLPQQSYSITAKQIDETINLKDPEDAVKYMPSLFVRKRNDGDNQAVLATRSWGLNSSARTLIYYDDLLISALIGNNNSGASPKWNLISPEAIAPHRFPQRAVRGGLSRQFDRRRAVDHLEDAGQAVRGRQGNGVGHAVESIRHQGHLCDQPDQRGGGRPQGDLSWLVSANYQDTYQQPLTYTTFGTVSGVGQYDRRVSGAEQAGPVANVIGTGALAHSQQTSGNLRLAYDVSPLVQATYSLGIWNNHQTSDPQTYLTSTATGAPTFGGQAAFANNKYIWDQTHLSNAVSLKSDTKGVFDFDLSASTYNYLQDILLNPFTVTPQASGYSLNGKITRNDGTNWQNADAKGIWRPFGVDGPHEVSFGVHGDRYRLENPAYAVVGLVRDAVDRHRPALFRPGSAKPAPALYGCRTPGRSCPI